MSSENSSSEYGHRQTDASQAPNGTASGTPGDDLTGDDLQLLRSLLACPSVTPTEAGVLTVLGDYLSGSGAHVGRHRFSEAHTPDVDNLFAYFGSEPDGTGAASGASLMFAGHTDVVPVGDASRWTHPPFAAQIHDGYLYGRGAVDMKGGIACFAAAARRYVRDCGGVIPGSISLLITNDEEGPAINGTRKLLDHLADRGYEFDLCILGEPCSVEHLGDQYKVGRRGSLSGVMSIYGSSGHVAYPHLADNPVYDLGRLLIALGELRLDEGSDNFAPSRLEVVSLEFDAGAGNVIPGVAKLRFNVRWNDNWTVQSLQQKLQHEIAKVMGDRRFDVVFEPCLSEVFLTQSNATVHDMIDAASQVTGRSAKAGSGGGTSDGRFIHKICPVFEYGLVGQTMHQIDEKVAIADVAKLTQAYYAMLARFFTTVP